VPLSSSNLSKAPQFSATQCNPQRPLSRPFYLSYLYDLIGFLYIKIHILTTLNALKGAYLPVLVIAGRSWHGFRPTNPTP
jgi:hypothetical protein